MPPTYNKDFVRAIEPIIPILANVPRFPANDVQARRIGFDALFDPLMGGLPNYPDVKRTKYLVKASDGFDIPVYRYFPSQDSKADSPLGPAILHAHGGGMISGSPVKLAPVIANYVHNTGVQFFAVDYRLAPEHQHPTLVEDCYSALLWLYENTSKFHIDAQRVAVFGESAGGGIAASLTLMARDRRLNPPLARQFLLYPMIDDRNVISNPDIEPLAIWNNDDNITGWTALLGDKRGSDSVPVYAAPARNTDFHGLPPAYIEVCGLDVLRDEDISYGARLAAANIPVDMHIYAGMPHSYEVITLEAEMTKEALAIRWRAVKGL